MWERRTRNKVTDPPMAGAPGSAWAWPDRSPLAGIVSVDVGGQGSPTGMGKDLFQFCPNRKCRRFQVAVTRSKVVPGAAEFSPSDSEYGAAGSEGSADELLDPATPRGLIRRSPSRPGKKRAEARPIGTKFNCN